MNQESKIKNYGTRKQDIVLLDSLYLIYDSRGGFITLLATLILGAVGMTIAVTLLVTGVSSTQNNFVLEGSMQARGLVQTCAEEALWQIHTDESFVGTQTMNLGAGNCIYTVVNAIGPGAKSIQASAMANQVLRKLAIEATVSSSTVSISSWQEIP